MSTRLKIKWSFLRYPHAGGSYVLLARCGRYFAKTNLPFDPGHTWSMAERRCEMRHLRRSLERAFEADMDRLGLRISIIEWGSLLVC